MLVLLSPSKKLIPARKSLKSNITTQPRHLDHTSTLMKKLKKLTKFQLKKLMSLSDKLAVENHARIEAFDVNAKKAIGSPAILTFDGGVYLGLDASTLSLPQLKYSQNHLRILSGLYGILRPLDLIQEYRLEMGGSFTIRQGKSLYSYWRALVTKQIIEDIETTNNKILLNLASDEYWKVILNKEISMPILKANFREYRNGKYKFISFNAKKARGLMARYVIENKVSSRDQLKDFNTEGYIFNEELSSSDEFIFTN